MLRITPNSSSDGTHKYFFGYYAETELDMSKWYGKAAKRLGLSGEIQPHDFEAICHNINPITKEQLTARNVENRLVGYDFTFSVPKSVSVTFALTQDKDILLAFQNSIDKTMIEIENNAETRVRLNGKNENRITGNLLYGAFTHGESRPVEGIPDPHLHKHVFIFNATYDEIEHKWKAAKFRNLKADAPYYEAVFRSHFANEIQKIGYQIERSKNDFEIKGFKRNLINKFSKRTKQIEEKAKELGLTFADDISSLGAKTRVQKRKDLNRLELKEMWISRLTDKERDLIYSAKDITSDVGNSGISPSQALEYSLSHNLERKSTVLEKDIYIHAIKRSIGSATPDEIKKALLNKKDLKSKKDEYGKTIFTTNEALKEEQDLIKSAREGRESMKPLNEGYVIKNDELSIEQANAVRHVLNSNDFISIISGGAGTGKTWSIKEVAQGIKESGTSFSAFAPSAEASRCVQRKEGFKDATTITELLQSEKYHHKIKGGVIWIDEAGMVGNKTMNEVILLAKANNARILLTGDVKQHTSVERGDALRIIKSYGGVQAMRINKIQRQKKDDYKRAIELISSGNIQKGVKSLDSMNAIKESDTFIELKEKVANEYVNSIIDRQETLIVATTHAQGASVTHAVREKLKQENVLHDKELQFTSLKNLGFTEAEKGDVANYQKGMSIQFHQNIGSGINRGAKYEVVGRKQGNILIAELGNKDKKNSIILPFNDANKYSVYSSKQIALAKGDKVRITQNGYSESKQRVNNGNILNVKGFDKNGNIIASSGKRTLVLDKNYGNLAYGYYTTSPGSQGKSVNKVIVVQSKMSGKAASKEQFYVSASRGKFEISIHTDDKENLIHTVSRSTQRMTATEIANQNRDTKIINLKGKFKKLNSMYRAFKSKIKGFDKSSFKEQLLKTNFKMIKKITNATPTRGK